MEGERWQAHEPEGCVEKEEEAGQKVWLEKYDRTWWAVSIRTKHATKTQLTHTSQAPGRMSSTRQASENFRGLFFAIKIWCGDVSLRSRWVGGGNTFKEIKDVNSQMWIRCLCPRLMSWEAREGQLQKDNDDRLHRMSQRV